VFTRKKVVLILVPILGWNTLKILTCATWICISNLTRTILKLAYCRDYCTSIKPNFESDKRQKILFMGGPTRVLQIQDGEWPPFWKKIENRHISATDWPIGMKFSTMTHLDFELYRLLQFQTFINPIGSLHSAVTYSDPKNSISS